MVTYFFSYEHELAVPAGTSAAISEMEDKSDRIPTKIIFKIINKCGLTDCRKMVTKKFNLGRYVGIKSQRFSLQACLTS